MSRRSDRAATENIMKKALGMRLVPNAIAAALFLASVPGGAAEAVKAIWMEADILHDLAEEYATAEIENSAESFVGDVRGNPRMNYSLLKRYLFLHPRSGEAPAATATYTFRLPGLVGQEKLQFLFAMGLRPGWREHDEEGADGVIFRVMVNEGKAFEQFWAREGWCYAALDLTANAGKIVRLTLVCDRNKNSSADWAMWGDPRVVLLRPASERLHVPRQVSLFVFETPSSQEITADWPGMGSSGGGIVMPAGEAGKTTLAWFPGPASEKKAPRLPRMTLADGASPSLKNIGIVRYMPKIQLVSVGQSSAIITPYEPFRILATLKNVGEGTLLAEDGLTADLGLPRSFHLAHGEGRTQDLGELGPSEEKLISWRVIAPANPGKSQFALRVGMASLKVLDVIVSPSARGIDYGYRGSQSNGFQEKEDFVALEVGNSRLGFVRDSSGFVYGTLFLKAGERWESVGRLTPLGELSIKLRSGQTQKIEIRPTRCARLNEFPGRTPVEGEMAMGFSGDFYDADSVRWRFEQEFSMKKDCPWIEVETSLTPDAPREVALFLAPKVLAGDGSFGGSKDQGILPGLEYLGEDEASSSTRDIAYPQSRRSTPHPLRVTIPLMAVRKGNVLVGISWDVHQKWYEDREMPGPLYSSPNRFPAQDNHLMALMAPSVPGFIDEGTLENRRTLPLAANGTLKTKASILVMSDAADITDVVVAWVKRNGLPEPKPPRDFESEIELCRHGFLQSVWNQSQQGWSHCLGWPAGPFPGYCTLLNMDYYLSKDETVRRTLRERIDLVVGKCQERFGAGSLWRGDACHILTGELPFMEGRLLECLAQWEQATEGILAAQSPDGSWRWRPDQQRARLGKPGDTTSGMCARGACRVLREAIVTGNRKHIAAALKALEFLGRYSIPTGAQEWECPIYAPDVLAAAYAIRAFVLAYEITGDIAYLRKAVFWARTGIPFIYLRSRGEEIPQMPYAGIPIFGATFYEHSWLGRPVQWCALVYAYSLIRLARYDNSLDWLRLAEGITTSAMWQQYSEGKSRGCYPDSWDILENHPNPADINPENILVNLLALNGYDPGLKHNVLSQRDNPIFVTSVAEILSAELGEDGCITLRLKFFARAKTYLVVAGLPASARPEIFLNSKKLAQADDIDKVRAGWLYLPQKGWLAVALTHSEEGDTLQVGWHRR